MVMHLKKNTLKQTPAYYIIPLFAIAAIIPVIVYLKVKTIDSTSYNYWTGQKDNYDFFSYYKAIFTMILSVASLLVFLYARYKKIINAKQLMLYYIPIAVYTVAIFLSALLSKYPNTAWIGFIDRYEGAYVLLSYLAILFTTINLVNNEKLIRIMLTGLFISSGIVGAIGIFQFFGLDLFKSDFIRPIILPSQYINSDLNFTFGAHTIYTTLYNTNFVGSFMAMLLPLSFATFLLAKNKYYKLLLGAFTCLMYANWVGCRSRAGYVGGIIAVIVFVLIMRKQIIRNIKTVVVLLVAFVFIFAGMDYSANGDLSARIVELVSKSNVSGAPAADKGEQGSKPLKDIVFADKDVTIIYGADSLKLSFDGSQLMFIDTEGKQLAIANDAAGDIIFNDPRYSFYKIKFDQTNNIFDIDLQDMKFTLYLQPTGFKIVGERGILLDKLDYPESAGFAGKEKFASMRGYIWSRSIPLLKNNILIGGGPDTYVMQFPQHDYVGKLKTFDMVGEIIDKPHNMYLQIGINTGVLSLLAVLFILVYYMLSSLRRYLPIKENGEKILIGVGLFAAVLGYSITAFGNDSIVSVAPVFWMILGLGISFNSVYNNAEHKELAVEAKPVKNQMQNQKQKQSTKPLKGKKG